jgi:hypothetical protein
MTKKASTTFPVDFSTYSPLQIPRDHYYFVLVTFRHGGTHVVYEGDDRNDAIENCVGHSDAKRVWCQSRQDGGSLYWESCRPGLNPSGDEEY